MKRVDKGLLSAINLLNFSERGVWERIHKDHGYKAWDWAWTAGVWTQIWDVFCVQDPIGDGSCLWC